MRTKNSGKYYDPYVLFSGLSIQVKGLEVYLSCPCSSHSSRDQFNAKFNMQTGEYISFGLCKKTFGKNDVYSIARWLREECGVDARVTKTNGEFLKKETQEDEKRDWRELLKLPIAFDNEYLTSRGVTNAIVEEMGIRADETIVVFPNTDEHGKIVGVNTRYTGKGRKIRYIYEGERTSLFRMGDIMLYDTTKPLVIVEGVFGAIRGKSYGYQTTALLGTGGLKDTRILQRFDKVLFGLDRDEAGLIMAEKLIKDKRIVTWLCEPTEYDELDEKGWERATNDRTALIGKYKRKWFEGEKS